MDDTKAEIKLSPGFICLGSGTCAVVRWETFEQMLRDTEHLHDDETLDGVKVDQSGIQYYIRKK